ncbi:protein of unknown function [Paraburkholderia kururiensis]
METNVQTDSTAPARRHGWMAAMLCVINAVAFIDRTALPLLIQPSRQGEWTAFFPCSARWA